MLILNEKKATVLIADDTPVNVKIIQKFLEPKGFKIVCATNGQEAIDKFIETSPDIVLMDVMMPIKDGYEATKEIKALSGEKWVPLIFLSAKSTIEDQIYGIEIGGDDYLTKPVDLSMLGVKVTAMLRIVKMQRQLNEAKQKLQCLADSTAEEIELAGTLMSNMMVKKESIKADELRLFAEAAEGISGDIALSYQCENTAHSYVVLADATGHGLTAAISLIPLSQLFYRLCSQNESVVEIARQINIRLESILPPSRFVAATIGFIDRDKKTIEVWNGANPFPRVVNSQGRLIHSFEKNSFCLGIVPENAFLSESEIITYSENCELLLFSDGIIDAQNSDEKVFGNEGIMNSLETPLNAHKTMFDKIICDLNEFRDHDKRIDDICILSLYIT